MKTVNDMYNVASGKDEMLLSGYRADFWDEYRLNHKKYDKTFRRMFKSFYYFLQEDNESIEEITDNFTEDVYNHLLLHHKKYSELFRINVLEDSDYSLTDNYNITETMNKDGTNLSTNTYGARTDSTTEVEGRRTDSNSSTLGSRTDTTDTTLGSRTDTSNVSYGQQSNSNTSKIAPYDSETFANNTRNEEILGAKIDDTTNVKGSETDTVSFSKGQEIDTDNFEKGEQTNTNNFIKGSQTDGLDSTYSEDYTLTRKGNIGVQTVTDMLNKHKNFWTLWDFYYYIFMEISKELLSI